jgi:hypothetical protein
MSLEAILHTPDNKCGSPLKRFYICSFVTIKDTMMKVFVARKVFEITAAKKVNEIDPSLKHLLLFLHYSQNEKTKESFSDQTNEIILTLSI